MEPRHEMFRKGDLDRNRRQRSSACSLGQRQQLTAPRPKGLNVVKEMF
jgi:hypothetical protein